jgi:hypothetical protein
MNPNPQHDRGGCYADDDGGYHAEPLDNAPWFAEFSLDEDDDN